MVTATLLGVMLGARRSLPGCLSVSGVGHRVGQGGVSVVSGVGVGSGRKPNPLWGTGGVCQGALINFLVTV